MTAFTPEQEAREREDAESLQTLTDGALGPEECRQLLRKFNGDLSRAADAFFSGDIGNLGGMDVTVNEVNQQDPTGLGVPRVEVHASRTSAPSSVIDLTQDDDDAAKFYTDHAQQGVHFGPSNRDPDPNWQVTLASDKPSTTQQRNDASLDHAIQASLADFKNLDDDELELYPMEETLREGQRPIALRPDTASIVYAALVLQALFAVPQVRDAVSRMELPDVGKPPQDPELSAVWHLVELFTNLDRAVLSSIVDKDAVPSLQPDSWNGTTEGLSKCTTQFLSKLSELIECRLGHQPLAGEIDFNALPNLFNFTHTAVECRENEYTGDYSAQERSYYVPVEVGEGVSNDLISKLASTLSRYDHGSSKHDVIAEPSDLLLFSLEQPPKPPSYSSTFSSSTKSSPKPFSFPKTLYLDRFMRDNVVIVNDKRKQENQMVAEIENLTKQKDFILRHNGRDTLQDMRNTLYYYEHVARAKGNPEREADLQLTKQRLQRILDVMVNGAHHVDQRIEKLQTELSKVFDCPELQQHRYDLRAVLMHTGLPGRKQVYSYVQDNGVWWKTLDYSVTEVSEETVLTDPTGLHLAAGPFLLVYSKHLSDEEMNVPITWPKIFVDSLDQNNQNFLSAIPPELAMKAAVTVAKGSVDTSGGSATAVTGTSSRSSSVKRGS